MIADSVLTRFGIAIRILRKQLSLSQEDLAERADLHRTYISDIERGARNVSLESIEKLAAALETNLPQLFSLALGLPTESVPSRPVGSAEAARVLLVEHDPANAELTLAAFKRANFTNPVDVVRDGVAAIEFLQGPPARQQTLPAVILLDLQIPKISGLEVLRRIKSDERTRNIPVAILTVSQGSRDVADAKQLGAETFIVKPVDFQNFSRMVAQLNFHWVLAEPTSPVKS